MVVEVEVEVVVTVEERVEEREREETVVGVGLVDEVDDRSVLVGPKNWAAVGRVGCWGWFTCALEFLNVLEEWKFRFGWKFI